VWNLETEEWERNGEMGGGGMEGSGAPRCQEGEFQGEMRVGDGRLGVADEGNSSDTAEDVVISGMDSTVAGMADDEEAPAPPSIQC